MEAPGGPRPGNVPPNYNPDALAHGMQHLEINRPNHPPTNPTGGPRPSATPFGQQPPSFAGGLPANRPGPPPPGAFQRGPPQTTLPPNVVSRPTVSPSVGQAPPSFASRPPPAGAVLHSVGSPAIRPPPGALPSASGPRAGQPGPFAVSTGLLVLPSGVSSSASNRPPAFGPGTMQSGPHFPPPSRPPAGAHLSAMLSSGTPSQPPRMHPSFGSPPSTSTSVTAQPPPPFLGSTQNVPPSSSSSTFAPPVQVMPPPMVAPYGMQTWQTQPHQVAPISAVPDSMQPPMMFGMTSLHSNQAEAAVTPSMGHAGSALTGQSNFDSSQIPRPIPNSAVILHETRQGNKANPPPPATSDYIVWDTGNCSPRFMRCTVNQIPCTSDLLTTSAMQLSLLVQPLALPHPSEQPIQVVDFGESGPVRCSRCKGYINPFMKFIDQGRRFICNLCGYTDETPRDYHCNLGPDGRRRDADERPELCRGTVEFVATKEYMVREPMPAVYFFLIDVSMNAIQTGATAAACSVISLVISDLPEGPRTLIGIATFDSTIHFYNLKRALQQPLMLIVPDVQDVYTPLQSDVIVQLSECREHLELLLENIPTMFRHNRTADSAFGAAVKAAFLAMKNTGGKLLVFQSVLPSTGVGALSAREAEGRSTVSAAETEAHKLLQPADKTLKTMAIEFAEYQVCVDVFLTTQSYVDIASISVIPKTTGGQLYYYFPFSAISDAAKLYNDLRWNITRPQGLEAVMRVRCSQGLQVNEYSGNYCKRIPSDVDLPAIDCDKTIMVTLKHDDKLQDGSECSFQCALLYTTIDGQRRIRISTFSLPCTTMLSDLFRSADLDTQFACILKQAASEVPTAPLPQIREHVTNHCINILYSYRKFCATASSSGQLILAEALKLLPLYTLALIKSTGLRTNEPIDTRSFWINYVSPLSVSLAIPWVHPRLIAIHELNTKENEESLIPHPIPLSSEYINDNGIYLLENGEDCLIYVGNSADPSVMHQLLGISSVEQVPAQFVLQQHDNLLSKKLNDIINEIRRQRCNYLRLRLCKKGDSSGMLFFSNMVEDKTSIGLSYVEFLVHIHRHVQSKMA
ncbi:protein transport protein Sec24-like At4g32640 [Solanum verrucosum]|uniref:protein transport protein Sec24-like At4g32640 n=1 Tax=Solanum verrucosum TaxID=315347 RepID=UPI0020D02583|nr:protein transport protein Sec24-like At4g32640 [Solanum verrucosum]